MCAQSIEWYAVQRHAIDECDECVCVVFIWFSFLCSEPDVSRWSLMDNDDDDAVPLTTKTNDDYTLMEKGESDAIRLLLLFVIAMQCRDIVRLSLS